MALGDVDYAHLLQAAAIIDEIGPDAARERCNAAIPGIGRGFQPANTVHIVEVGRDGHYEHRVLIALAHALQYPDHPPIHPKNFQGFNFREYFRVNNNAAGAVFGWTEIHPDPAAEEAFDRGFAA